MAADTGTGVALFLDEMQDLTGGAVRAVRACHELSQSGAPLIVVGAGLPHLPVTLSAAKSYSERLFRYQRIDWLDRLAADRALVAPAAREQVEYEEKALTRYTSGPAGIRTVQLRKATWDHAPRSPITAADVRVAAQEAEAELAVGFFGARYERATPAEREYLRTMADLADRDGDAAVATAAIAAALGRKPTSLSPARDALIKKGLIYSGERGTVAFTVPHFGRYLRSHPG